MPGNIPFVQTNIGNST